MDLHIRVIPNSKHQEIIEDNENFFKIKIKAPAKEGKANKELIEVLAKKYKVGKSRVEILKGISGKDKLVRIYN